MRREQGWAPSYDVECRVKNNMNLMTLKTFRETKIFRGTSN